MEQAFLLIVTVVAMFVILAVVSHNVHFPSPSFMDPSQVGQTLMGAFS